MEKVWKSVFPQAFDLTELNLALRSITFRQTEQDALYEASYAAILEQFEIARNNSFDLQSTTVCFLLTYSWMGRAQPDIPKLAKLYDTKIQDILMAASSTSLTRNEMENLCRLFGNSSIGLSKFLHFTSPERYPIWDQHVARGFGLKRHQQFRTVRTYLAYLDVLPFVEVDLKTRLLVEDRIGSQTECRFKEFVLFHYGCSIKD